MAKTLVRNVYVDPTGASRTGYGPLFGNESTVPNDVAALITNPAAWALTAVSQAAMLALSGAEVGDVCIRTDTEPDSVYILTALPPATLANWTLLNPQPELSLGGVDIATQAELNAAISGLAGTYVKAPTSGTLAARPAATIIGQTYLATDTAGGTLYLSLDGATWTQVAAGVSAVGMAYTEGLESARPAAGAVTANAVYFSTDYRRLYRSNGVDTWTELAGQGSGIYGDGSDGDVTIAGTVTLTRDMFYDTLTVPTGTILNGGGCRIYCRTKCDIQTGGILRSNGGDAALNIAGAAVASVTLTGSSRAGVNNAGGGVGNQPAQLNNALGGTGGAGGNGTPNAGAAGGVANPPAVAASQPRTSLMTSLGVMMGGTTFAAIGGGGGGGGGGGDGVRNGGAGGGGGGPLHIAARVLVVNGTLQAKGGAGGNGGAAGNAGGGGGGGGGVLLLTYDVLTGSALPLSAATNCPGGLGGTATGTGVNGSPGVVGAVRAVENRPL